MGLATYAELKDEVALWLRRTDLTAAIPGFIALAEAQMNRRLKASRSLNRASVSLTAAGTPLPPDFSAARALSLSAPSGGTLDYLSAEALADRRARRGGAAGRPSSFTVSGSMLFVDPAPAEALDAELVYWARLPPLSDVQSSNWLLAEHPDAYLYGALTQSAPYLRADERLGVWAGLFTAALDDIAQADAFRASSGRLAVRATHAH